MMRLAFTRVYIRFVGWLMSFGQCHKTSLGYNCHHSIYADGTKECD